MGAHFRSFGPAQTFAPGSSFSSEVVVFPDSFAMGRTLASFLDCCSQNLFVCLPEMAVVCSLGNLFVGLVEEDGSSRVADCLLEEILEEVC